MHCGPSYVQDGPLNVKNVPSGGPEDTQTDHGILFDGVTGVAGPEMLQLSCATDAFTLLVFIESPPSSLTRVSAFIFQRV